MDTPEYGFYDENNVFTPHDPEEDIENPMVLDYPDEKLYWMAKS